ncbi:MAG: CoA transferase [Myxococcales bacterium]|nr:CoA transferase [Myxococcales bacterium]
MPGPLDGIRILDTTAMFSGPLATMILGDQGADVVKIEVPGGTGDTMRVSGISRGGIAATFHAVNRNKRSIVVDLRDPRGVDVVHRLADGADVFVENYRPGVADRLGIGADALRARNPRLVYVSLSAWGDSGPLARRPAFDSILQATAGYAASQAGDDGRPELVHNSVVDKVTGLVASQAITAALLARERGAGGQHVRLNMLDTGVAFLWIDVMQHRTFVGDERTAKNAWLRLLRTRDGWVMISLVQDAMFAACARALDDEALARDPRFARAAERMTHLGALCDELEARTAGTTTAALCARLRDHDVPHAPVTALEEVEALDQVRWNETLLVSDHPASGRVRHARPVARFEATPASVRRLAPALGEHTDEVLREIGIGAEAVAALRRDGVVA